MSDDGGADDFSSLGGFFFYSFIVHPATAWILRPGRFERKKSIMYAIAFLAALAAVKTGEFFFFSACPPFWTGCRRGSHPPDPFHRFEAQSAGRNRNCGRIQL
jgi:hypothetical protein